ARAGRLLGERDASARRGALCLTRLKNDNHNEPRNWRRAVGRWCSLAAVVRLIPLRMTTWIKETRNVVVQVAFPGGRDLPGRRRRRGRPDAAQGDQHLDGLDR